MFGGALLAFLFTLRHSGSVDAYAAALAFAAVGALCGLAVEIFLRIPRPYKFTLRTLLIAMSLIAVGLGLVVWSMR